MSPLRAAGWLVREQPDTLEPISWDGVGGRLERAGVVGAGDAVAAVAAAVEEAPELHGRDPAVFCETGLDLHQNGMTPPVRVEDFLTRERDLHRPSCDDRQFGGHQLMREDVALAAEAASIRGGDHADAAHRQLEHLAKRAVHVMRGLR